MPYTELLRVTVLLIGAEATALGAIGALAASRSDNEAAILIAAVWWLAAVVIGLQMGHPDRAAEGVRDVLASARTATSLPPESPTQIALGRLWPIGLSLLAAGVLGIFFPSIAIVGAGYALLVALAWRTREAAVLAIERRDGVRFYVVPTSAFRAVQLVRSPGLRTDPR